MGPPWSFSATPARVRSAASLTGGGEEYVYQELLGLSAEEVRELIHDNVIH